MTAIDPGTEQSALVVWDGQRIIDARILINDEIARLLEGTYGRGAVYCEMIEGRGMPVGKPVFETCVWIGEFRHAVKTAGGSFYAVYRRLVKLHHCGVASAKDSNVIRALKDKYGDKGTKRQPGLTYPLKADLWQAFALATFASDTQFKS